MPTNYNPFDKAILLVKENKVIEEGRGHFVVIGTTDNYNVFFNKSRVSCTCHYYSLHGCKINKVKSNGEEEGYTKGHLCSHIMAVIIYSGRKEIKIN